MICVISWLHPTNLPLYINLVITKHELKSQYVKLTQLWPLIVNYVKVGSQSYLAGLTESCQKSVSSAHMQTKWLYSRDLMFYSNFSVTIFSIMFFPLVSKVFTDILKIYELPKYIIKYLNIALCSLVLAITICQANSMP